ncbi:hypothetical protein Pelo_1720 [Pelomyxa schiedti]|nr:hypothetical protein Pelo_1720 [Pelomyxa schiedti]
MSCVLLCDDGQQYSVTISPKGKGVGTIQATGMTSCEIYQGDFHTGDLPPKAMISLISSGILLTCRSEDPALTKVDPIRVSQVQLFPELNTLLHPSTSKRDFCTATPSPGYTATRNCDTPLLLRLEFHGSSVNLTRINQTPLEQRLMLHERVLTAIESRSRASANELEHKIEALRKEVESITLRQVPVVTPWQSFSTGTILQVELATLGITSMDHYVCEYRFGSDSKVFTLTTDTCSQARGAWFCAGTFCDGARVGLVVCENHPIIGIGLWLPSGTPPHYCTRETWEIRFKVWGRRS